MVRGTWGKMEQKLEWTLDIGGIALTLAGPAFWVGPFARVWERWSGTSSGWLVYLEMDDDLPEPAGSLFAVRPCFAERKCLLGAQGFAGEIIPSERFAHLRAYPVVSLGDLAYFVRTVFALAAFEEGGLLFHAAGVVHRDVLWAFFGPSGSGKTTAASLSRGKDVLSDDLIFLRRGGGGWEGWATPFSLCRGGRRSSPLRALVRLVKAPEDRIVFIPSGVALGELVANSPVVNADPARLPELFIRWEEILAQVPVCALHFRKTEAFWEVIDAEFG